MGHDIQVIDAAGEALDQLEDADCVGTMRRIGLTVDQVVDAIRPDAEVVGLTHMFMHEWPLVHELAERINRRFPSARS